DHYALARLLLQTPPPFTCGGPTGSSAVSTLAGLNEVTAGLLLQRACALDPGGFWPHFVFGQHAYRLRHYPAAIAAFGVSVGVAPRQPAPLFNRALAHAALGREATALRDFEAALRLDRSLARRRAVVHYNLAVFHLARQDRAAALRQLEAARTADPRDAS